MLLVDLDNIYIINYKPDLDTLKKRLKRIQKLDTDIRYFGNEFTNNYIKTNKIPIKVKVSKYTGKDASDHELIHYGFKKPKCKILTNDKTLQKLSYFIYKQIPDFYEFASDHKLKKVRVDLCLNSKEMLGSIIKSYELYKTRF